MLRTNLINDLFLNLSGERRSNFAMKNHVSSNGLLPNIISLATKLHLVISCGTLSPKVHDVRAFVRTQVINLVWF